MRAKELVGRAAVKGMAKIFGLKDVTRQFA
jgi:hypothetical protein